MYLVKELALHLPQRSCGDRGPNSAMLSHHSVMGSSRPEVGEDIRERRNVMGNHGGTREKKYHYIWQINVASPRGWLLCLMCAPGRQCIRRDNNIPWGQLFIPHICIHFWGAITLLCISSNLLSPKMFIIYFFISMCTSLTEVWLN